MRIRRFPYEVGISPNEFLPREREVPCNEVYHQIRVCIALEQRDYYSSLEGMVV